MSFKTQIAADASVFINADEFAESITYNGTAINATTELIQDNKSGNSFSSDGSASIRRFVVSKTDVSNPKSGDKIVYNSITWYFARIIDDYGLYTLEFTGNESSTRGR